jgi:hypothetical protein
MVLCGHFPTDSHAFNFGLVSDRLARAAREARTQQMVRLEILRRLASGGCSLAGGSTTKTCGMAQIEHFEKKGWKKSR